MMEEQRLDIPVVMFVFKRKDTCIRILERIRQVQPRKLYIIADAGRNEEEMIMADECRNAIEQAVDWDCEVIRNYAKKNRGVHAQIGLGAKWVFEREPVAIFLEDDNLPQVTFFEYCRQCLKKYENEEKIFWICGTNYLQKCKPQNNASVFASRHLMPCGWASWAWKYNKYYDADLKLTESPSWQKELRRHYKDKRLFNQQCRSIRTELFHKTAGERYRSWVASSAYED